jgi:lysozyme
MKTSDEGLHVLKYYESCRLEAYPDPATGGEPITIGWGSTYPGLKLGDTVTQAMADELLADRLAEEFEPGIETLLARPALQHQFDAMVCWAYNVGLGAAKQSTLMRLFNTGASDEAVADQFLRWDKAAGKSMWGLRRRRSAERALFRGLSAAQAIDIGDRTV